MTSAPAGFRQIGANEAKSGIPSQVSAVRIVEVEGPSTGPNLGIGKPGLLLVARVRM